MLQRFFGSQLASEIEDESFSRLFVGIIELKLQRTSQVI